MRIAVYNTMNLKQGCQLKVVVSNNEAIVYHDYDGLAVQGGCLLNIRVGGSRIHPFGK